MHPMFFYRFALLQCRECNKTKPNLVQMPCYSELLHNAHFHPILYNCSMRWLSHPDEPVARKKAARESSVSRGRLKFLFNLETTSASASMSMSVFDIRRRILRPNENSFQSETNLLLNFSHPSTFRSVPRYSPPPPLSDALPLDPRPPAPPPLAGQVRLSMFFASH